MKKHFLLFTFLILFASVYADNEGLRKMQNHAYKRGESLSYRVFYDSWLTAWITAGVGTVEVLEDNKKFHGRDTYHMRIVGKSVGLFSWFFKVRDRFESYVDMEAQVPWKFIRRTREGDYRKDDDVIFNQFEHWAESRYMKREIPPNTQDIVSAFYVMRNLDFSELKVNDEMRVQFMLDDSVYISKIIFLGKDTIDTKIGKIRALKFKPKVVTGEVFDEQYPMTIWVSDDPNHIPLMLKSAVIIGSISIEITDYKNLKNPFSSKLSD